MARLRIGMLALLTALLMGAGGELGLWRTAVPLGEGSPARAVERGDQVALLLRALEGGIDVDDATADWLADLRDSVLELDLQHTWKRLPDVEGSKRTVRLSGQNNHEHQRYDLLLGASVPPARATFGDLQGYVSLEPRSWSNALAFRSQGELILSTNDIGHPAARGMAAALLSSVEAAQAQGSLDARLRADFPHAMGLLEEFQTFETTAGPGPDGTTAVDLSVRIDADRLAAAGYPTLAGFLTQMANVADFSVSVDSRAGELGTLWLKSPGQYGIRFHILDGQLVPVRGGSANTTARVDVGTATSLDLALRPRGIARLKGTRLSVQNWTVPLRYRVSGETARLEARFNTLPSVDFRSDGGFGGFVVATAGNAVGLQQQALRFFRSVAEGPAGTGTLMGMQMAPAPEASHQTFSGDWHLLLLDNLVVRFAAQILGHRIVPENAVLEELLELEGRLMGALANDWEQARPRVAAYSETGASSGSR